MENRTERMNRLLDRLNVQLALKRRNRRKPKTAHKKEQLQHASLICKLFNKSLKVKLKANFASREMIIVDFMVLENFLITPNDNFIDLVNIDEITFV
ncbi:MAG: hypothetical protein WD048_14920 [Chitinophagales bacterium]